MTVFERIGQQLQKDVPETNCVINRQDIRNEIGSIWSIFA